MLPTKDINDFIRADLEDRFPTAGDIVRLTGPWMIADPGDLGVIGGVVGERQETLHICFNFRAFRGWSTWGCPEDNRIPTLKSMDLSAYHLRPVYVSASGGPATIATPAHLLTPTNDTQKVNFWAWRSGPTAHGGFGYRIEVPVWEWDGKGS